MSKHTQITILGLLVALMPFLGFPGAWKTFFFVVSGLGIAFLALTIIARRYKKRFTSSHTTQTSENMSAQHHHHSAYDNHTDR